MAEQMVERVEVAIRKELFEQAGIVLPKMDLTPTARAAIEAMREPTTEMYEAFRIAGDNHITPFNVGWKAAIDAALKP